MTDDEAPTALVVDDSQFMRSVISDILQDGNIDVVGKARHGREAVEMVADEKPDVVTMDVEMPEMGGLDAVERIMATNPTPVLMLSAHTDERADITFEALERGAVDFFTKPGGEVSMEMTRLEDQLVDMVRSVASVDPVAHHPDESIGETDTGRRFVGDPTLVIGSSTGGPTTVENVLSELPRQANFRLLIVQHMPDGFTSRFADRIDSRSDYDVKEADDGDVITGGEGLVAPGDAHMEVSRYRDGHLKVRLSRDSPINGVTPAVDPTMETAAEHVDDPLIGVILTGMGNDGADGVRELASAGGQAIAQDESTSAVFGMPRRAIETGAVDHVLPVQDIPDGILSVAEVT